MNSIVISGGDGFLGSHLAKYLVECNYEVFIIVLPKSETKDINLAIDGIRVVEGKLSRYEEMIQSLPNSPIAFFHCAWSGVTPDQRDDFECQMKNIEMTTNAVRLASAIHSEKFIFPGSTMEYIYYGKPIDKDAIPSPPNAYGAAKISARYVCSVLCNNLKIPFIYVVIAGIYSEDRIDNNVIYYTISKLLHNERPSLTKLEQLWDYVHIDDVVYGLRLVAEKGRENTFYALGHGDNWPLFNYIYLIRDIIDPTAELGIGDIPYIGNELPCSCINLETLFHDTGFVPQVDFDQGIRRVITSIKRRDGIE